MGTSCLRLFREDDDRVWLFDHLVGPCESYWRQLDPQRLGDAEVDPEIELGGALERQLARINIPRCVPKLKTNIAPFDVSKLAQLPAGLVSL
jgi:hypothetical protein